MPTGQDVKDGEAGELLVAPPFGKGGEGGISHRGETDNFPADGKV